MSKKSKEEKGETQETEQAAAPEMPRFDFSDCGLTEEEVSEAEKKESNNFFRPGKHDVKILDIEFTGLAKDPNWGKFKVTFEGTNGRQIMDFPLVPFKTPVYKSEKKDTMFPWKKFKGFCGGLGIDVTRANVEGVLKTHFADVKKLKSRPLKIEVGFQRGFVAGAGDDKNFKIVLGDGNDLCNPKTKETILFADRAAAHNYAEENKLSVDKYSSVLSYEKSEVKESADGN